MLLSLDLVAFKRVLIRFFTNKKYVSIFWILLAFVNSMKEILMGHYPNYKIFKGVYWHLIAEKNLYLHYWDEYYDINLYGPLYSILIAPFALMPDLPGGILYNISLVGILIYAIHQLELSDTHTAILMWLTTNELSTALLHFQFNIFIAAGIILSFIWIRTHQIWKAATIISIGFLVKIYGIVGLGFLLFTKQKIKLGIAFALISLVLVFLPALISSVDFTMQCYHDWYVTLIGKNAANQSLGIQQDISVYGMIRRMTPYQEISNVIVLLPACVLLMLPFLHFSYFKHPTFQYLYLCSFLIFTVIFSTGAESATYIIAYIGVVLWFLLLNNRHKPYFMLLFGLSVLLTTLSPTDLFPKQIREEYIIKYSLKALPCFLIWLTIAFHLLFFPKYSFESRLLEQNNTTSNQID